jgi:TonB family protein
MHPVQLGLTPEPELELQPKRAKTLAISACIHLFLFAFFAFNPKFFQSLPKRIIRIAGQDYDLSKNQLTELITPPPTRPKPPAATDNRPLIQPRPQPQPRTEAPKPPPPPPPPPPPRDTPVISPEDVIADGARPDGQPKASRGNTEEAARAGNSGTPEPPKPAPAPKLEEKTEEPQQLARNTNPNALRLPGPTDPGRMIQQSIEESQRRYRPGDRTGIQGPMTEDPNFSTEEPTILSDTRGYDFGPYMNQVVNRVRVNWYSLIPEIARLGKKGRVVIIFTITQSGAVTDLRMVATSGTDPLDRAAQGSITASNPFPRLPSNFEGNHIVLQFTFLYNLR